MGRRIDGAPQGAPLQGAASLSALAKLDLAVPGRATITGAPEGHDAHALGGLVAEGRVGTLLHVCRDDGRMARFASALGFFHPGLDAIALPAWDCLPYDRVSP